MMRMNLSAASGLANAGSSLPRWVFDVLWIALLISVLGMAAILDHSLGRPPIRDLANLETTAKAESFLIALANEVLTPSYRVETQEHPPQDKVQYQSQSTSLPIVSPRVATSELKQGAHYPEGEELHVTPESDLEVQLEPIEEAPPESETAQGADEAKSHTP